MGDEMEVGAIRMSKFIVAEHEYPELYAVLSGTPGRARNGVMRRLASLGLQALSEREAAARTAAGAGAAVVALGSEPVVRATPRPAPDAAPAASQARSPAPEPAAADAPKIVIPAAAQVPAAPAAQVPAPEKRPVTKGARGIDKLSDEFLLG
jgi:hypothetical protein